MVLATNLGFPRIGAGRELKKAIESFWAKKTDKPQLAATCRSLRERHWRLQQQAGIDHIPSNDFSLYDHVLDTTAMVGAAPPRFGGSAQEIDLPTYFAMARGGTAGSKHAGAHALEMTKWFDTNYHYLVPEFETDQTFQLASRKCVDEFLEAKNLGITTRPVLLGPVTYLLLGKMREAGADRFALLDRLLPVYQQVLGQLAEAGAKWVQIDEPCLALDLTDAAKAALAAGYARLAAAPVSILAANYFGPLRDNLDLALSLPIDALHVDLTRGADEFDALLQKAPVSLALSLGVVDGRNVWRADLDAALQTVERATDAIGRDRVMVAPSCSLLHAPVSLDAEVQLDDELRGWLAFAQEKLAEVAALAAAANGGFAALEEALAASRAAVRSRQQSPRVHNPAVRQRTDALTGVMLRRASPFEARKAAQQQRLKLPLFPTTTIGSFPQTKEVRAARRSHRRGEMSDQQYEAFLKQQIADAIRRQEELGLDVLVHGEPERNDMVEYFGEQLDGFAVTAGGWVQSYGSRCVKPPIIFGDVSRPGPMTLKWTEYAQSLTSRPVKGMLTGPVTILQWSFVRDDQPRSQTCRQIALAIRDETADLEQAGVSVIQIDEPALREGLPLRRADWADYLTWAVDCFRLSSAGASDETQIHTHMCYCEFHDILESIAALDADVISIETARSQMELLDAFTSQDYANDIGPGVYDIHSPRVPAVREMTDLLHKALGVLQPGQLWVNPDCGLKTRRWDEVTPALAAMTAAARELREGIQRQ